MVDGVRGMIVFERAVQFFDELYLLQVFCRSTDGLKMSAFMTLVAYSSASPRAMAAGVTRQSTLLAAAFLSLFTPSGSKGASGSILILWSNRVNLLRPTGRRRVKLGLKVQWLRVLRR